ncbi:MAG: 4-hydroxy-3-methylbut-2-enyl diphosphate reductase [Armatimonadetes bacterium]|nr:4-hydroxy-3-methylbut-2-enyl diphosphate reductase [Armatimonadota bacterium]
MERIVLAAPRGFCAGVAYAIDIVNRAIETFGTPLFVRHAIVHNEWVVRSFEARGVVFVEDLAEVPEGQPVVFSAHGVSPAVRAEARQRELKVIDATCPLVDKVHREAREWAHRDHTILYIGHQGHVEAEGTMGEAPERMVLVDGLEAARTVAVPNPHKLTVLTQTTLSVDEVNEIVDVLVERFPALKTPKKEDICYATTNRQEAVKELAQQCDLIIVVGSTTSSNTNRLREVAESCGAAAHLVSTPEELREEWLDAHRVVGVTSGASTPEVLVDDVLAALMRGRPVPIQTLKTAEERIHFRPPRELVESAARSDD